MNERFYAMMEWEMHPATQPATIAYKQLLAKVVNKNVGHYEYKKLQVQRQYLHSRCRFILNLI